MVRPAALRARTRSCLFVLSEGGGRAFPLTEGGVWLAQIPPDQTRNGKGTPILRRRKSGRTPKGGNKPVRTTMRPRRKLAQRDRGRRIRAGRETGPDWFRSVGGAAGVRRARGHAPGARDLPKLRNYDPIPECLRRKPSSIRNMHTKTVSSFRHKTAHSLCSEFWRNKLAQACTYGERRLGRPRFLR